MITKYKIYYLTNGNIFKESDVVSTRGKSGQQIYVEENGQLFIETMIFEDESDKVTITKNLLGDIEKIEEEEIQQ